MIDQAINDMNFRIQEIVGKIIVNFMKTVDAGHNKSLMKNALRRVIHAMWKTLVDDDKLREDFEAAVGQKANSNKMTDAIANALVVSDRAMAPATKFEANGVQKEVCSLG